MTHATVSSGRPWTQDRFLTRQVDRLDGNVEADVFLRARILDAHLLGRPRPLGVKMYQ